MKLFILGLILTIIYLIPLPADMPGATTYGRQVRVNGKIVNQPYNTVATPYYYQGNLVYPSQGSPYRNARGQIQYQTNYTQYPWRNSGVNYSYEAQRMRQQQQQMDQYQQPNQYAQPAQQNQYYYQPYNQPGQPTNQGY